MLKPAHKAFYVRSRRLIFGRTSAPAQPPIYSPFSSVKALEQRILQYPELNCALFRPFGKGGQDIPPLFKRQLLREQIPHHCLRLNLICVFIAAIPAARFSLPTDPSRNRYIPTQTGGKRRHNYYIILFVFCKRLFLPKPLLWGGRRNLFQVVRSNLIYVVVEPVGEHNVGRALPPDHNLPFL